MDWLPEHPPHFMKRVREPSEKSKKAKKARLRESYGSRPLVPLAGSPSKPLQARALTSSQPSHSEPEPKVTSPPPEHPNPTTFEPPQTPPPAQQPTHSPSQPNPQPEQPTPTPSAIPTPTNFVASITPTLNLSARNSPSPSSLASATEQETAFPTLEEAIQVFAESSVDKIKSLTINSGISDDPFEVRIH
ncbi:uncharacterized protein LOC127094055 [Lathyrus oleraceus]|uniref:uncharacterized protein LOC127094055 n=1 Tax=Pisum sativum TaxID=3888 RepID=UPI0021CF2926|nr:uncharacterized protein LOC127094055 [Pisum sativum]